MHQSRNVLDGEGRHLVGVGVKIFRELAEIYAKSTSVLGFLLKMTFPLQLNRKKTILQWDELGVFGENFRHGFLSITLCSVEPVFYYVSLSLSM